MIRLTETSGDTLVGAVDGVNKTYVTSYNFDSGTVTVYIDGSVVSGESYLCGGFGLTGFGITEPFGSTYSAPAYTEVAPNIIVMNIAPASGSVLEIEYESSTLGFQIIGGGAEGGVPEPPQVQGANQVEILIANLKPDIIVIREG